MATRSQVNVPIEAETPVLLKFGVFDGGGPIPRCSSTLHAVTR